AAGAHAPQRASPDLTDQGTAASDAGRAAPPPSHLPELWAVTTRHTMDDRASLDGTAGGPNEGPRPVRTVRAEGPSCSSSFSSCGTCCRTTPSTTCSPS